MNISGEVLLDQMSMETIDPVHTNRKGDPSDPNNYRGITVGMCMTKLLAMILDDEIHEWTDSDVFE